MPSSAPSIAGQSGVLPVAMTMASALTRRSPTQQRVRVQQHGPLFEQGDAGIAPAYGHRCRSGARSPGAWTPSRLPNHVPCGSPTSRSRWHPLPRRHIRRPGPSSSWARSRGSRRCRPSAHPRQWPPARRGWRRCARRRTPPLPPPMTKRSKSDIKRPLPAALIWSTGAVLQSGGARRCGRVML